MKYRLVALAAALVLCAAAPSIRETGSTLLLPLMSLWVGAYERAHPDIAISVEGTGSGEGIAQAMAGSVDIGASDAYLSDGQLQGGMLNVPLAVSAQVVAYNLAQAGQTHINFSGDVLAGIYSGTIQYWDDARIRAINPQLAKEFPHDRIFCSRTISRRRARHGVRAPARRFAGPASTG